MKGNVYYNIIDWGKEMQKNPLIGISLAVVCVVVLASFTNVVSVQTVESSHPKVIKDGIDQKDLLFQTILDIANNREIQRLLFNFDMRKDTERFSDSSMIFSIITPNVFTKKELNSAYTIGLILTKTLSASKIHSILQRYQVSNRGGQQEITAVIEKDATLNGEITQLSNLKCNCENVNTTRLWNFPVLCLLLFPLFIIGFGLYIRYNSIYLLKIIAFIGVTLNCFWTH